MLPAYNHAVKAAQSFRGPRRTIYFAVIGVAILLVFIGSYSDVPMDYYRNYAPGDAISIVGSNNDKPQPGYFKDQPEWDFDIPSYTNGWGGYARKPRNRDIVILTAGDGQGHNSEVPNILDRVMQDREDYCQQHGYTHLWLNTSRYDMKDAHRTWSKIPAVAEAFHQVPNAEWVWLIDTDVLIMNREYDLVKEIVGPAAIKKGILKHRNIVDGDPKEHPTGVYTPSKYNVEDVDILITQGYKYPNTGSVFFRRSAFTRWTLEMMTDSMLMGREIPYAEQDAIKHLMLEHHLVQKHVGIYPQRKFNAFVEGGDQMGYRDGDLLVHMAGCWVRHKCKDWFEEFWAKRGHQDSWRPGPPL